MQLLMFIRVSRENAGNFKVSIRIKFRFHCLPHLTNVHITACVAYCLVIAACFCGFYSKLFRIVNNNT